MQKNDLHTDVMQEVKDIIDNVKVAMFTTSFAQEPRLTSRPLHTRYVDFDGTLWFLPILKLKKSTKFKMNLK